MAFTEDKILTEKSFDRMGWHDCPIYGIRFEDEILFDLDYILKWEVHEKSSSYKFWIAPATLIFHKPQNLKIDIEMDFINGLEIADIEKEKSNKKNFRWIIKTQEGEISFESPGYTQYLRLKPKFVKNICLTEKERHGYCFDLKAF